MARLKITFYPAALPSASPLVIDETSGSALKLMVLSGEGPLTHGILTTKGPGQPGTTALDVGVPPRVIGIQALVDTADWATFFDARDAIGTAMVGIPVRFGQSLDLGRLLFERNGETDLELYGAPQSALIETILGTTKGMLDAEWYCPYPYFQETSDTVSDEIDVDASETIVNPGDVDAPFIAKIYGPATEVSLTNLSTGEIFTVTVALANDTEWLQVDTTPGGKSVRKYTSPTSWANAIAGLSTSEGQLWQLRPGNNSVKLEADGDSGDTHATLTYRPRYHSL